MWKYIVGLQRRLVHVGRQDTDVLQHFGVQETESMSGGDPSKMGDFRDDENFSPLNMNWQALQWAGYRGSREDIRTPERNNRINAKLLYRVGLAYLTLNSMLRQIRQASCGRSVRALAHHGI